MTNPEAPINPIAQRGVADIGLTKREYFAGVALQGLLAQYLSEHVTGWKMENFTKESVLIADALIAELNKQ